MISLRFASLCLGAMLAPALAFAEAGTAEQAKVLLDTAASHYTKVGRAQAINDFNDKQGAFVKGDLYVFCYGPDHTMSAHGANMNLVGKDIGAFKDSDGKPFADMAYQAALADGETTIDYRWADPVSKKIQPKSSFYKKVDKAEVCGVGFYKS